MSDSASLNSLVASLMSSGGDGIHVMRDPTRGGLATVLCEIAAQSGVSIEIREESIPVKEAVKGACELLGYDPLYLANEGKMVAVVSKEMSQVALDAMRSHPEGREARIIGEVSDGAKGKVVLHTLLGGRRLVDRLAGEMLPRIC